jgi:hypothetical protein
MKCVYIHIEQGREVIEMVTPYIGVDWDWVRGMGMDYATYLKQHHLVPV